MIVANLLRGFREYIWAAKSPEYPVRFPQIPWNPTQECLNGGFARNRSSESACEYAGDRKSVV